MKLPEIIQGLEKLDEIQLMEWLAGRGVACLVSCDQDRLGAYFTVKVGRKFFATRSPRDVLLEQAWRVAREGPQVLQA